MFGFPTGPVRRIEHGKHHQLSSTRVNHTCPKCETYAYHSRQSAVTVGKRVHHPSCSIVRGCMNVRTAGSTFDKQADAPFVILGALGVGLLIAARSAAR